MLRGSTLENPRSALAMAATWMCPLRGWLKVNFDASMNASSFAGMGMVVRNMQVKSLQLLQSVMMVSHHRF